MEEDPTCERRFGGTSGSRMEDGGWRTQDKKEAVDRDLEWNMGKGVPAINGLCS
jgi:hypothetical protein